MPRPEFEQITLRDGRTLAYLDRGDLRGVPILYCHGAPSSRVEIDLTVPADVMSSVGARFLVPDRPGMGRSDFLPGRRIVDWPSDALELMDALGIESFFVLGSSAGSPYALACAALAAQRVRAVGVVGGLAPPGATSEGAGLSRRLAGYAPALVGALIRLQLLAIRSERSRAGMARGFPEPDRTLLKERSIRDGFIACFEEACRNGTRGVAWEQRLLSRPWSFDLRAIKVPVLLWQGERDGNVSAGHAKYLAATIPACRATYYPADAHLSVWLRHRREIVAALIREPTAATAPALTASP